VLVLDRLLDLSVSIAAVLSTVWRQRRPARIDSLEEVP
jgi:hypothetical protein